MDPLYPNNDMIVQNLETFTNILSMFRENDPFTLTGDWR